MWMPGAPADRGDVPGVGREARAADHVDPRALGHGRLQRRDLAGIVLAVAVDLDHVVVAVLLRVREARLYRAADAEVERETQHPGAGLLGARGGVVGRAVVDHDDVEVRRLTVQRPR